MRTHEDIELLENLLSRFESVIANTGISQVREDGTFKYVPLGICEFIRQLHIAKVACSSKGIGAPHFVDVGCGLGTKLLAAKLEGFLVTGIEIDPVYAEFASKLLFGNTLSTIGEIILKDALLCSYKKYDVIYFYCPFISTKKELELERLIVETAKPGAIILANNAHDYKRFESSNKALRMIGDSHVFEKRESEALDKRKA